jgi:cell division protein FtsB
MFEAQSTLVARRVLIGLLFAGIIAILAFRVVDPARTARADMLERQLARLQTADGVMARDNERLLERLRGLETGPEGWKDLARRQHGMLSDGEVIFRFPVASR